MDDSELTKRAVEELVGEMKCYQGKKSLPTERKKNPLGKPNKRFLGRTIKSVMRHNKRQSDNNHRKCQRKLNELNAKKRKREYGQLSGAHVNMIEKYKSESSHEMSGSNSEDGGHNKRSYKNLKQKKKKRKRKQNSSSSSISSSSSNSSSDTDFNSSSISSRKKHKNHKESRCENCTSNEKYKEDLYTDPGINYYVYPDVAYAAIAYNQMNQILQQQIFQQEIVKEELEESVDIPSDLNISYSESSLNISLNSSSAEEDENGILTFKLSSDEEKLYPSSSNVNNESKKTVEDLVTLIESDDNENSSIKSYISLDSTSSKPNGGWSEVLISSSSTSDSEDLVVVDTITENKNQIFKSDILIIDENVIPQKTEETYITTTFEEGGETSGKKLDNVEKKALNVEETINKDESPKIIDGSDLKENLFDNDGSVIAEETKTLSKELNTVNIAITDIERKMTEGSDENIEENINIKGMANPSTNILVDLTEE